ncbi:MAG: hypothetical protein AAGG48_12830 [Planctomycetota bacterium]
MQFTRVSYESIQRPVVREGKVRTRRLLLERHLKERNSDHPRPTVATVKVQTELASHTVTQKDSDKSSICRCHGHAGSGIRCYYGSKILYSQFANRSRACVWFDDNHGGMNNAIRNLPPGLFANKSHSDARHAPRLPRSRPTGTQEQAGWLV